jgi:hypothetical protein
VGTQQQQQRHVTQQEQKGSAVHVDC